MSQHDEKRTPKADKMKSSGLRSPENPIIPATDMPAKRLGKALRRGRKITRSDEPGAPKQVAGGGSKQKPLASS